MAESALARIRVDRVLAPEHALAFLRGHATETHEGAGGLVFTVRPPAAVEARRILKPAAVLGVELSFTENPNEGEENHE